MALVRAQFLLEKLQTAIIEHSLEQMLFHTIFLSTLLAPHVLSLTANGQC
eukprot:m.34357 g.34357  ORF g.34357 m.34357 type:complete len:50 (-) comp7310_c0_seq2:2657-2806(-)